MNPVVIPATQLPPAATTLPPGTISPDSEEDTVMEETKKTEGLKASMHAPSIHGDEREEEEAEETPAPEGHDEEMNGDEDSEEEKPSGLEICLMAAAITLRRLMDRASKSKEMGFWKGKRAMLCEEAMGALQHTGLSSGWRTQGVERGCGDDRGS